MKNNETGEFELVVGNKQLLSGFFIVVLLFAVAFAMGYVVGQNTQRPAKLASEGGPASTANSAADSRPQPASPVAGVTGDAGCGRESAALLAVLAGPPSDASLAGRWVFCPTTYPMANATANSSTTIKKPLSSCLLPTTSSNSPVSLFFMCYVVPVPGVPPLPTRSSARPKEVSISSGSGKTMVLFFSAPISTSVCRYRN